MLTLRPATILDAAFLFNLRTDPETARQSESPPPSWDDHTAWLVLSLGNDLQIIYIAWVDRQKVGMGRLDWHPMNETTVLSLAVCPEWRGNGFAPLIIKELVTMARAWHPYGRILAHVKSGNVASLRAFLRAEFRLPDSMLTLEAK